MFKIIYLTSPKREPLSPSPPGKRTTFRLRRNVPTSLGKSSHICVLPHLGFALRRVYQVKKKKREGAGKRDKREDGRDRNTERGRQRKERKNKGQTL